MQNNRYANLENWTEGRLQELRRVAATEKQLRELRRDHKVSWINAVATRVGQTLVAWGMWLQHQAKQPASATQ